MTPTTAAKILNEHWNMAIPVDPVAIANRLGIVVQADPFLDPLSGEYTPAVEGKSAPVIRFNSLEAPVRQRFTIAHEIGHHALGHGAQFRDTSCNFNMSADHRERDANRFAAELLMPAEAIKAMIHVRGITNLGELASMFKVSKTAMTFRLEKLGYVVN